MDKYVDVGLYGALSMGIGVVDILREQHPNIQAQTMKVFLHIALSKDGVYMSDLRRELSMGQSSVTRNVQLLSKTNRHGKRGFCLVETYWETSKKGKRGRRKFIRLSEYGKTAARRIYTLMYCPDNCDPKVLVSEFY